MNEEYMPIQPEVSGVGLVLGVAEAVAKAVVNFGKMVVEDNPRPKELVREKSSTADALELLIVRAKLKTLMAEGGTAVSQPKPEPVLAPAAPAS